MRPRFYELVRELLDDEPRLAVVTAEIGTTPIGPHPRHFNVGIREQLMIGVAAGLALEGYRPVAHSYAPFLVERPYEQVKLDLGHNDLGAMLVSTGASYDAAREGRTHQAPEDVAALAALPGWTIHVPGHVDELEQLFRNAVRGDDRVYIRLSEEDEPRAGGRRRLRRAAPRVAAARRSCVAVGPSLAPVIEATADLDVSLAYLATVRPFPRAALREALGDGDGGRPRRAVSRRHLVRGGVGRARRSPAPPARARRPERGVPPLRRGRGAPRRPRTRRGGDPGLARVVPAVRFEGVALRGSAASSRQRRPR